MANSNKDSRQNVSLEELLRFKRAERPDEAFWQQFDRELHERMMQTLVKKDPWFVQVMRGLTGKIAQTTAIAAAAAVLALMVIRPAFIPTGETSQLGQMAHTGAQSSVESVELAESSSEKVEPALMAEADYRIEGISARSVAGSSRVTQDFGLDNLDVASYDRAAYSADMMLPGLTSAGVASIVY